MGRIVAVPDEGAAVVAFVIFVVSGEEEEEEEVEERIEPIVLSFLGDLMVEESSSDGDGRDGSTVTTRAVCLAVTLGGGGHPNRA